MVDAVVLSKIAVIVNENFKNNSHITNQHTFQCKQRTWQLLDSFENDADELVDIIQMSENGKFKGIAFVESEDRSFLLAQYVSLVHCRRNKYSEAAIDKLFAILYPDDNKSGVRPNEVDGSQGAQHMLKAYVTTQLFDGLQKLHCTIARADTVRLTPPSKFLPTLCRYQKNSVLWLLSKENVPEIIPAFFKKLEAKDRETIVYKHLYLRYVQNVPPPSVVLPPGGILADEMGLGKTVEILALILLNPRTDIVKNPDVSYENAFCKLRGLSSEIFCICTSNSRKKLLQCEKCKLWQHSECVGKYGEKRNGDIKRPYFCPSCWRHVIEDCGLIKSKATLIVSPNTIKLQWLSEIRRHIQPTLRVFLYDGVVAGKWVCPSILAEYDIVLTDYNVLRGEVYYTSENVSERTTRNKPRSIRMHSPLLMIEWWRVCLDEAQMVESNTSKVSSLVRMIPVQQTIRFLSQKCIFERPAFASMLTKDNLYDLWMWLAINRWAVTGTPIQRSLDDLQPLLKFVGFDVAAEATTWNCLVHDFSVNHKISTEKHNLELIKVLQKCMWRTSKLQILDELQIPPQQETVHHIQFDNLEKLFYNDQHANCKANFLENVHKYTRRTSTISPQIMRIPFLKIRQSCTMPVVVTSSHTNNAVVSQQKQFLQPKELHDYLKSANEICCKSELRTMASSHNGLAALYFIQQRHEDAKRHYDAVLKLASEYKDMQITVDSLLQIHALHNVMEIKKNQTQSICERTTDSNLEPYEQQYNTLEWKYLSTYSVTLKTVMACYTTALDKINTETGDCLMPFMSEALCGMHGSEISMLLQKIHEECMPRFGKTNAKVTEIHSVHSLMYVIDLWFTKLEKILCKVKSEIYGLKYFTENVKSRNQVTPAIWSKIMELVHSVYDCHLSVIQENEMVNKKRKLAEKCKMCHIRDYINSFECLLFDKVIDKISNFTEGMENPSFEMFLCKLSFAYLKNRQSQTELIAALEKSWLHLENLQTVCKRLIKLWIEMEYTIKAYDELNMCKMRISLTEDPANKSICKILKHEIDQRTSDHKKELYASEIEFVKKLARLRYINHLKSDEEMSACPICQLVEQDRYAVLECGHHICLQCLQSIRQYSKSSILKCSVCRNIQQNRDVYYVSRSNAKKQELDPIKGNYSSKITYLVRLILNLQKQELEATLCNKAINKQDGNLKILIFSQWIPILRAIALALKENDISFRLQCTPKMLEEFKNPSLGIICLLMPFIKGSKGLNLVEATHVFLMEPILNPGEELQAIGRVHRFGQKRSTMIHRLIMRDSIEENIFNFISSSSRERNGSSNVVEKNWEFENVSLDDFKELFALKTNNDFH